MWEEVWVGGGDTVGISRTFFRTSYTVKRAKERWCNFWVQSSVFTMAWGKLSLCFPRCGSTVCFLLVKVSAAGEAEREACLLGLSVWDVLE